MSIHAKGVYAVTAMIDLADNESDRPVSLADLAQRQAISLSYLEQIFARLRQSGLINSVRGPGGGYRLSREPSAIRVSDIVLAVSDHDGTVPRPRKAQKGKATEYKQALDELWRELDGHVVLFLSSISLEDVMHRRVVGHGRELIAANVGGTGGIAAASPGDGGRRAANGD